jgi:GrpB-like predicted nucleotidyltransferase (UPF0157 family)/GNAT superfamily N-acetyltransferase
MKQTQIIEVVSYNPEWPHLFEGEAKKIKEALGGNCLALHHVGSTSVPGLAAKPKLDMIGAIKNPIRAKEQLEGIGFRYRGEYNIPLHYGFSFRGTMDINLHVYEEDHPEIELNLMFRDYLRNNPSVRDEYADLKEQLLQDETSFEKNDSPFTAYTLRKGDFIRECLRKAGFNRLRMLKCNDDTEWLAAKEFRQKYFFDKVPVQDPYTWTFNHPDHAHLILYLGTEIIGYAHIQLWQDKRAAIRIIVLDESKRLHGYGKQFLAMIEKWLKVQGYFSLHAESSPAAYLFYQRLGYINMPFNDPDGYESDPIDTPVGKGL